MLPQDISKLQTRHRKQSALPHLISGTSEEDISSMLLHCLVSRGQLVSGGRAEAMLLLHARLLTLSPPIGAEACSSGPFSPSANLSTSKHTPISDLLPSLKRLSWDVQGCLLCPGAEILY